MKPFVAKRARHQLSRSCIRFQIVDGVLHYKQRMFRLDGIDDIDVAIQELLAGKAVWLVQSPRVVNAVQRTVELALTERRASW